jgi:hypothetical protein
MLPMWLERPAADEGRDRMGTRDTIVARDGTVREREPDPGDSRSGLTAIDGGLG